MAPEKTSREEWAIPCKEIVDEIEVACIELVGDLALWISDEAVTGDRTQVWRGAKVRYGTLDRVREELFIRQANADDVALAAMESLPAGFGGPGVYLRHQLDSSVIVALQDLDCAVSRRAILYDKLDVLVLLA